MESEYRQVQEECQDLQALLEQRDDQLCTLNQDLLDLTLRMKVPHCSCPHELLLLLLLYMLLYLLLPLLCCCCSCCLKKQPLLIQADCTMQTFRSRYVWRETIARNSLSQILAAAYAIKVIGVRASHCIMLSFSSSNTAKSKPECTNAAKVQ